MCNSCHHVKNYKHLCEELASVMIRQDETFASHGVVSLFTNTPILKSMLIIRDRLEKDVTLKDRTKLYVDDFTELLEFVLLFFWVMSINKNLVSPIVANLFIEYLKLTGNCINTLDLQT